MGASPKRRTASSVTSGNFDPAWAFLRNAGAYPDLDSLQDAFARAVGAFGFNQFSCSLVVEAGKAPAPRALFGRSNKAWDDHYLERGYLKVDPCVRLLFSAPGPFTWSDLGPEHHTPASRLILSEAAAGGACEGFVVPVWDGKQNFYGVRLISPEQEFDQSARATLHALATVYVCEGVKLLELTDDSLPTCTPLTRRETECLKWVAEGKSDWDISELLGISEATVHAHVEHAKKKIGVKSRVQAVVLATVKGWLSLPTR